MEFFFRGAISLLFPPPGEDQPLGEGESESAKDANRFASAFEEARNILKNESDIDLNPLAVLTKTLLASQTKPGAPILKSCANCHTATPSTRVCGSCRTVSYCGKSCQVAHWPLHKGCCASSHPDKKTPMMPQGKENKEGAAEGKICELFCANCGKTENLQKCSRCKKDSYCGKVCQKAHWVDHKQSCIASTK